MDPEPSAPPIDPDVNLDRAISSAESMLLALDSLKSDTDSMPEDYSFQPLQADQIRLLEIQPGGSGDPIQCCFHIISLEDEHRVLYGALSYTWGDGDADRIVLVDGKAIRVKPNLEAALLEFRRKPPEVVPLDWKEKLAAMLNRIENLLIKLSEQRDSLGVESLIKIINRLSQSADEISLADITEMERERLMDECIEGATIDWNYLAARHGFPTLCQRHYLWIDSLCINQQNNKERTAQVRLMAEIYAKASLLVVWLGDIEFESPETVSQVFTSISTKNRNQNNSSILRDLAEEVSTEGAERALITNAIFRMLRSPWHLRAWIRQEYILGCFRSKALTKYRTLTCCGVLRLEDFLLIASAILMQWHGPKGLTSLHEAMEKETRLATERGIFAAYQLEKTRIYYWHRRNQEFQQDAKAMCLRLFKLVAEAGGRRQATDPRDLIYSVIGLVEIYGLSLQKYTPTRLLIDYEAPLDMIYTSFVREIVENTGRLDILAFCYEKCLVRSWCPNWSKVELYGYGLLVKGIVASRSPNYLEDLPFNVTPNTSCVVDFSGDLASLTVTGLVWSIVETELWQFLDDDKLGGLKSWCQLLMREASTGEINLTSKEMEAHLIETLMMDFHDIQSLQPAFEAWLSPESDSRSLPSTVALRDEFHAKINWVSIVNGLFITDRPGACMTHLGSIKARSGDCICLILGCAAPIVLRPVEQHFEVLGEAFVPGIMQGEAMKIIAAENKEWTRFGLR